MENKSFDYIRKLGLIEHCIFGVDIQEIAIQISKLRFFISLVVEQEVDDSKPNRDIKALPNLETKFVAANTLIGLEKPAQMSLTSDDIRKVEAELFTVREEIFYANSRLKKLDLQKREALLREKLKIELEHNGFPNNVANKIATWDPFNQNKSSDWFDPEWMFGITGGFDVVIGNPPYVEHKKLKEVAPVFKKCYSTYSGTADIYVYFYENGIKNLSQNGTLVFITSNKFVKTSYGENLRKYFTNFRINEIIDFTDVHVFEALVASCVVSITNKVSTNNKIKIAFANDSLLNFADVAEFIDKNKFFLEQQNLSEKIWQLDNVTMLSLKKKIENGSVTMNQTGTINIYRGVTTGYNPAFIIDDEKRKELIKEDKANKDIIKPLLQGRNIRKWIFNKSDAYLLQTGFNTNIKKEYPSILKHLDSFKQELEVRTDQGINYWNLRACKYYSEFEKEKIIWGLTADKWAFAYDNEKNYLPSNGYILTSTEIPIKYLLALMNSKLMELYFGFIGIMTAGGAFTLKYETVIEFPIKNISLSEQNPFITLVDKILESKKKDLRQKDGGQAPADTTALEREIDLLVYKLYGLTEEDIQILGDKLNA